MDAKTLGQMPVHPSTATRWDGMVEWTDTVPGMTLRQAFAKAALQGLLANPTYAEEWSNGERTGSPATAAVYHADQLLFFLAKEQP